MNQLLYRADL